MSLLHAAAMEDEPTPDPSSAVLVRDALTAAIEEARRLYGSETGDAWFAALADGTHPLCRTATPDHGRSPQTLGALRPRLGEADLVTDPALLEAAAHYAGDVTPAREIADVQAGRHPLQRRAPPAP